MSARKLSWLAALILLPVTVSAGPDVEKDAQQLARSLGALYQQAGDQRRQIATDVAALSSSLKALARLQKTIRERDHLGLHRRDSLVRHGVLQHGAVAWLHGWGAFAQLVARAKDDATRSSLRNLGAPSPLRQLLTLHGVLVRHLDEDREVFHRFERATAPPGTWANSRLQGFLRREKSPLLLALWGRPPGLWARTLRHRHAWGPPADWGPARGVPNISDLVGRPSDEPRVERGVLTVWALVNLELDRASRSKDAARLNLESVAAWLEELAGALPKAGLTRSTTVDRLRRLAAFLRFRAAVQDAEQRDRMVEALRNHWLSSTRAKASAEGIRDAKETSASPALVDLLTASGAFGGEALPQARIWLRHLVLRSYLKYGLGGAVHPMRGVDPYWTDLTKLSLHDTDRSAYDFVRWHAPPARGHADHALWVLTEGTLELLELQRRDLEGEVASTETTTLRALSGYLQGGGLRVAGASDLTHALALQRDLRALHHRLRSPSPLAPATTTQRLNGPWPLAAYPTLSFKAHAKRLTDALAGLKQAFDVERLEDDLRHHYQQARAAYERSRWAEQRAGIEAEIAREGEKLAQLLYGIAQGEEELQVLVKEGEDLRAEAATHDWDASKARLEKAHQLRALAAHQLMAYEGALKQSEALIAKAQEQLSQYPPRLIAEAERLEEEQRRSVIFAIAKAVVSVVGAALAPFTGGASMSIASGVNQALTMAESLINADWSTFDKAVLNVTGALNQTLSIVGTGVAGFGSKEGQKAFAEMQKQITTGIALSSEGLRMASALVNGDPIHQRLLAMAASQVSTTVKDGRLCVEVLGEEMDLGLPPEIQEGLKGALESGGLLVKKAGQLRGVLDRLKSLDETIKAAKKDWGELAADARIKLERRLAKIKQDYPKARQVLEGALKALPADQRMAVETKLAGAARRGLPIVVEGGKLVCLVPRAAVRLSQETIKRLEDRATSLAQSELNEMAKKIQATQQRVSQAIKDARESKDPQAIRNLATVLLPQKITQLQMELSDLQAKTVAAKIQVEERMVEAQITESEAKAAEGRLKASLKLSEAAEKRLRLARRKVQAEEAKLGIAAKRIQAAGLGVKSARSAQRSMLKELLYAYRSCLAAGFDPHEEAEGARREGIFSMGSDPKHSRAHRALRELAGMVRWIHLLDPKTGVERHSSLLKVTRHAWLESDPPEGQGKSRILLPKTRRKLRALARRLQLDFEHLTSKDRVTVSVQTLSPARVDWYSEGLGFEVQLHLRKVANRGKGLNPGWRHYVLLSRSAVVWPAARTDTTAFPVAIWPPPTADLAGAWPYRAAGEDEKWRGGARRGTNAKSDWKDKAAEQDAFKDLTGATHALPAQALGTWRFDVATSLEQEKIEQLKKQVESLKVKLVILSVRE